MRHIITLILLLISTLMPAFAYKIGDIVQTKEGDIGIVFYIDQEKVLLASLTESTTKWGEAVLNTEHQDESGVLTQFDGKENTKRMVDAAAQGMTMQILDVVPTERNWYVPSLAEMIQLSLVSAKLKKINRDFIYTGNYHWTSSTLSNGSPYIVGGLNFYNTTIYTTARRLSSYKTKAIYKIDLTQEDTVKSTFDHLWNTGDTDEQITDIPKNTNTYTVTVTNTQNACKSIASKTIIVSNTEEQEISDTICEGESFTDYGFNATETGTYTNTIKNDTCFSKITLHLTVAQKYTQEINEEICFGQYYNKNGFSVTPFVSGEYHDTVSYISQMGCDSLRILNLNVKPITYDTVMARICQNENYKDADFDILSSQKAGTNYFTVEKSGENGCKSYHTLALQVDTVYQKSIVDSIYEGFDYNKYGFNLKKVTTEGLHKQALKTETGCDSTINLQLNIRPIKTITTTDTICEGTTFTWDGIQLNESGTYTDSVKTSAGCDSIRSLKLTVLPTKHTTINDSVSRFGYYDFGNKRINEAGSYSDTLTSVSGCDSIVTLNLSLTPLVIDTVNLDFCNEKRHEEEDYPLIEYKTTIDTILARESGSPSDHIVVYKNTYHNIKFNDIKDSICEGESYKLAEQILMQPGSYSDTLRNSCNCCDSIITTLNLSLIKSKTVETEDNTCENKEYTFGGETKTYETGTYHLTITEPGDNGCDSTTLLTLNVLPNMHTQIWDSIAEGESYNKYGFNIGEQGRQGTYTYNRTIGHENLCDSIVTLNLVVNPYVAPKEIPTAFSPGNKDGVNDIFMNGYEVYIYDRYGNLICHSATGWDGTYRGKYADPGVYVYIVTMKDGTKKKGTIEVLKN